MIRQAQLLFSFFILIFAASLLSADEENKVLPIMPLYPETVHHIFEERVNVRATPSLEAKVLGIALIGEAVEIVTRVERSEVLYGIEANWYKVRWKGRFCYIWGGLLSTYQANADFDGDGREEILMSRSLEVASNPITVSTKDELRLCRKGELLSKEPFTGSTPSFYRIAAISGKGFRPEIALLELRGGYGDGAVAVGATYLFYWSKERFFKISEDEFEYINQDARYSKYVFPSDEGGKRNILQIEHRVIESDPENSGLRLRDDEIKSVKEFLWDGEHFTPIETDKKEDKNE